MAQILVEGREVFLDERGDAVAGDGRAREPVDAVIFFPFDSRVYLAFLDLDPDEDVVSVTDQFPGPFGGPLGVLDLAAQPRRLAVLVKGDAANLFLVRLQRDVAVDRRPQPLA